MAEEICGHCAASAIKHYKFIKMCKENPIKLYNSILGLCTSFESTIDELPFVKSLIVSLNTNNFTTEKHYDCKQLLTKRDVYKTFLSCRRTKYKITNRGKSIQKKEALVVDLFSELSYQDDYDIDNVDAVLDIMPVKIKKNRCEPIDIPLQDVLYDVNDPQNFKCKVCLVTRASLSHLKQHFVRFHAPKIYKCPDCPRKYGSPAILNQHRHGNHLNIICSQCGKKFHTRTNLKAHEMTHGQPYVCTKCGRPCKNMIAYKNHIKNKRCGVKIRRSNTEATYACDKCNKKYSHKASLRVHCKFAHGDGKSYECTWCSKKFDAPSRLKAHIVKHTKEKNFVCDICNGKFVTKESLVYHRRIHTGEKPYECNYCEKTFLNTSRRAEHVRRRHQEPSLECGLCPRKFKTRSCLMRHKNRHFNPSSKLHYAGHEGEDSGFN